MDRLHDPAWERRKAAVQLLQLFTAEARRFTVHMEQAVHAYEVTGVPPSGPLWKAASNKAAKLSAAAMPGGKADMAQLLKPFAVFIEERRQMAHGDERNGNCSVHIADVVEAASAEWNMMMPDQQRRYQDVCWTGQTMEGALAYLASDRIGLGGLPPDLSVSAVDLQPEPARHTQTGVLVGGDLSLRPPELEPQKKRPRGRPPNPKNAQRKAASAAAKVARREAKAAEGAEDS